MIKKVIIKNLLPSILGFFMLILSMLLFSCGGGFDGDNENADQFYNPIFSNDTTSI